MGKAEEFLNQFDDAGRFRPGNGVVEVVFTTVANSRYPGKLSFKNGLCIRAEMEGGGTWSYSDNSPISGLQLLLHFDGENPHVVRIDDGKVVHHSEVRERPSKREFLSNFRIARNLFGHPAVQADTGGDSQVIARRVARAAIWLTPKSVKGFDANDFPELGLERQRALQSAVTEFKDIAKMVPSNQPASDQQYGNARVAFMKTLDILTPYLSTPEEGEKVEQAIGKVQSSVMPPWIVNWDYELDSDEEGVPAVRIHLYIDDDAPWKELGRVATQLTVKFREVLSAAGVTRWPYVRIRTAAEHKVG